MPPSLVLRLMALWSAFSRKPYHTYMYAHAYLCYKYVYVFCEVDPHGAGVALASRYPSLAFRLILPLSVFIFVLLVPSRPARQGNADVQLDDGHSPLEEWTRLRESFTIPEYQLNMASALR